MPSPPDPPSRNASTRASPKFATGGLGGAARPTQRFWCLTRQAALVLTGSYLLVALLLLTNFDLNLAAPEKLDQLFNDMAARLLHWDFSITPSVVKFEAFVRNGVTTAYYGIFPALLRMPFVLAGYPALPLARLSCLIALGLTVHAYIRLFQHAVASAGRNTSKLLAWTAVLSAIATGPQIFVLASASLYHELIFWAASFVAMFNLVVMRRWFYDEPLLPGDMIRLALLAGICLICRLPDGVALYIALFLLLARECATNLAAVPRAGIWRLFAAPPPWLSAILAAGALCLVFVVIQAVVNEQRWGSILVTAPYQYYVQFNHKPAEQASFLHHGAFSLQRIPLAILYYGTGIKLEHFFPAAFADLYGGIEGPRAVTPLCAPLLFLLAPFGLWRILRGAWAAAMPAALALGSLACVVVVLGFLDLALRYMFDGWALLVLLAAIGFRDAAAQPLPRWVPAGAAALLLLGTAGSALTLLRYKINYSGTDAGVRYGLSATLRPILCPNAKLSTGVKLSDFNPLVTPACPPLW